MSPIIRQVPARVSKHVGVSQTTLNDVLDVVRQQKQSQKEQATSGPQIFFRAEQKKKYLSSQVYKSPSDEYVIV